MNEPILKLILKLTLQLALAAAPVTALAQPAPEWRCLTDSLDAAAALQRLEWARTCALTTNSAGPASWVSSTRAFDTTFSWAKEYIELNTSRAFSGNLNSYNVNYYYAYARYSPSPIYTVFQETSGPTAGFWKWSHTSQRPRPLYPVFETTPVAGGGTQLFPLPTLPNDCSLYQRSATGFSRWTGSFFVIAYCESTP